MDTASSSSTAELPSSNQATHLKNMLIALGFPKPPDSITPVQIFAKVEPRIEEQIKKLPNQNFGKPLFDGVLTAAQWKALNGLNEDMNAEYRMRAEMLLKRLDVTIQSFTWSDRLKKKEDELSRVYKRFRQTMTPDSTEISIADLLSARNDLTLVEKTCSGAVREKTKTKLNKVLMGRVPDRGGRPTEIEAPPPEMPPWMKREAPPQRGGGHRGGRGGYGQGGGPRVQGAGWQAGGGHGQPDWGHGGGGHAYAGFQGGQQQQSYGRGGGQQHYNSGQAYQQPHQQMYDQYGGGPGQGGYNQQGGGDYRRGGRGQRGGSGYR